MPSENRALPSTIFLNAVSAYGLSFFATVALLVNDVVLVEI